MSFSRRQILKAAGCFAAGITATNAKKASQIFTDIPVASAAETSTSSQSNWVEKILNSDGTINWTEYTNVANNYDRPDIIDYRLGPSYTFYHSTPENIPTLWGPNDDGFFGNCSSTLKSGGSTGATDWYAMSGQLLFSPDTTAAAEYQPGVARARNGSIYLYQDASPEYCFDTRVQWTPDAVNYYNTNPEIAVTQQSWKDASGGSIPAPPIATVRTKATICGVTGYLIFKNGLIGVAGTGNDGYIGSGSEPYHLMKLPAGKIPTAAAVTPNNEFLLVTVWDTKNRKGQVAVIAIKGRALANEKSFNWGFPNWPTIRDMKLLGYVNLPFAAPTAIQTSVDYGSGSGRGFNDNQNLNLDSQTERDTWYNWSGSVFKRTARSGYAVVLSRAEDKAAFIDLQPLLEYYRMMYFTTQDKYDSTKNEGTAPNQWPYTFSYSSQQKPKVVATINVKKPTAVAAGLIWSTGHWRDSNDTFRENVYIATMDGELRMYKVGNLMTTDSEVKIGEPFKIVAIAKNPTSIDYGHNAIFGNDIFINCRGDKAVYYLYYDGTVHASFRDARLQDPVYVAVSNNSRGVYSCPILSVIDFKGRQVVNYRYQNDLTEALRTPVGNPSGSSVFEYGHATSLPGQPFMFTLAEVI